MNGLKQIVPYKQNKLKSDEDIFYKNFLLLHVDDKAGVLAKITQVFAECDVSLDSVVQQANPHNPDAEIIIVTHNASRASMNKVLRHLEELPVIHRIKSHYRVEG
ncbi:Homoserine dehydrogenase [compost metagenome]